MSKEMLEEMCWDIERYIETGESMDECQLVEYGIPLNNANEEAYLEFVREYSALYKSEKILTFNKTINAFVNVVAPMLGFTCVGAITGYCVDMPLVGTVVGTGMALGWIWNSSDKNEYEFEKTKQNLMIQMLKKLER